MADEPEIAVPWYQQKKWVVSAGLVLGVGLGIVLLEPVVDDIVPGFSSESAADPELSDPEDPQADGSTSEDGDGDGETTDADGDGSGDDNDPDAGSDGDSGSSDDPDSDEPYELEIFDTEDIEVEETNLKVISAELSIFPVDKDKLRDALEDELDHFRGEAHAVSFRVFYDRREGGSPAFGSWNWAPDGDWTKADEGDPDTWDDYEWKEPEVDKIDSPDSCAPPAEVELELVGAYLDRQTAAAAESETGDGPTGDESTNEGDDDSEPATTTSSPATTSTTAPAGTESTTTTTTGSTSSESTEAANGDAANDDGENETDSSDDIEEMLEQEDPQVEDQEDPEPPDPDVITEVAEELGTSVEEINEALENTASWVDC